jgi:ATP-binding cassette subfamily B protein
MELAFLVQQYPQHRSVTLRLLEPLGAAENASDEGFTASQPLKTPLATAPSLGFYEITVEQAGNLVLSVPELFIPAGEHVAMVGVSGAGKSSLVGLLLGWYPPSTGKVLADGLPLRGEELARLRRGTVWVDPTVQLWNRSLLENLRDGADQERKPLGDAVEAAELDEVLARLPMGLQTPVGANGALLSGGEGQRVRLARGIGRGRPRLVILDEAFSGLERTRRSALLAAARVRWRGATLICITHDISETMSFPRVLVIERGRVIEDGAPAALAADSSSRYAGLLAAEKRALAHLTGTRWRRFRVESGAIEADPVQRRPEEGSS